LSTSPAIRPQTTDHQQDGFQQGILGIEIDRACPPVHCGMADIDAMTTVLILFAVGFWDDDLCTIPTCIARMSQKPRDAVATLVLINAVPGVSMK
jgi:hypothetical protein